MNLFKVIPYKFLIFTSVLSLVWACSTSKQTKPGAMAKENDTQSDSSTVSDISPTFPSETYNYIRELVDNAYSHGIVVALITDEGVTYRSYGKTAAEGDPIDENTIFEIGSITKAFTAILLSDMIEQGKLTIDDSVQTFLPSDVTMPGGDAITLEDLATHRSGLPRLPDNIDVTNPNPYADYTTEKLYTFLSGYALTRDPDTQYEYSNLGSGLLGHIMSLVTGKSFEELVLERISKPLKMNDTGIALTEEQRSRFSPGYDSRGRVAVDQDFGCLAGCGALRSTATDLARFVEANLGLYETDLYSAIQRTHEARAETGQADLRIGLGWHILTKSDREIIWHNGGTGGYRSFCGFIKSQNMGVVVLSNSTYDIDIIGLNVLDREIELPVVRKTVKVALEVLETYTGIYQLTSILLLEVTLDGEILTVQLTGELAVPAFPESETDFFSKDIDAQVTFEKDSTGKVVALILHQGGVDMRAEKIE